MHRWVNAGSTGIAVIRSQNGERRLGYLFDIADTHPVKGAKRPWTWQLSSEYEAVVSQAFAEQYGTVALEDIPSQLMEYAARAAAGSDARMNGCVLPVVINSGSGNQGITVSVPLIAYARKNGCDEDKLYRALAISNLLALHQKKYIGKLSAYCGAISASAAAGAAMTWLQGGDVKQIEQVLVNTLATVGGVLCDGAKASCASKIAIALETAWTALELAQSGYQFPAGEGLVAPSVEDTIRSFGYVAREGMRQTDVEILKLMTGQTKFECI